MELTVGIILVENNKMLLVHPTGADFWSIPKGIQEDGETDWVTAKRELHEETNINLADYDYTIIKKSSTHKYKKRSKYAKAFLVVLNEKIKTELKCNTFFDNFDNQVPECDGYEWVDIDNNLNIHYTQKEILRELI